MSKKLSAPHKPHHKEQLFFSLEYVAHPHQKRMVSLHQNVLLQLGALYLIVIQNYVLPQ